MLNLNKDCEIMELGNYSDLIFLGKSDLGWKWGSEWKWGPGQHNFPVPWCVNYAKYGACFKWPSLFNMPPFPPHYMDLISSQGQFFTTLV